MVSLLSVSYAQWLSTRDAASLTHSRIRRQRPLDERQPAHDTHGNVRSRACAAHELSSSAGANHREPGNSVQIHRRPAARRRRVRSSVPRAAARTVPGRARDPLHQGQHAHRRLAPRGVFRAAARRAPPGHSRLRRVPAAAARDTGPLLPRPRVRALRRSERVPAAPRRRMAGANCPAGDRRASSRCSASCTAASCCIAT